MTSIWYFTLYNLSLRPKYIAHKPSINMVAERSRIIYLGLILMIDPKTGKDRDIWVSTIFTVITISVRSKKTTNW